MSEPTTSADHDVLPDDELRQHTQTPAEGPDDIEHEAEDVPREHTQQPTEG